MTGFEDAMVSLLTGYASGYIFYYVNIAIENAEKEYKALYSCVFLWGLLLGIKQHMDRSIPNNGYNVHEEVKFILASIEKIQIHIDRQMLYVQSISYEMHGILIYVSDEIGKFENINPASCKGNILFPFSYKGYASYINRSLECFENLDTIFYDGNEMLGIMYKYLINSPNSPVSSTYLRSRMESKIEGLRTVNS